jgi:membrane protein YdbS with pleckstrin-like domain
VKEDNVGERRKFLNIETVILFILFLLIAIIFYILLSAVRPDVAGFGIAEILFSLIFSIFTSGFLVWTKNLTKTNAYLGVLCGIIASVGLGYAFNLRYSGTYSTVFMILTGIVILIYLGRNFFKYK